VVDARTPLFGIVAHPIAHLRAPEIFNAYLAERGIDGVMVAFDVAPADLAAMLEAARRMRNLRGFCVSNPHKETILPLLDRATDAARRVGAVNIVRREADGTLTGTQGDGEGFATGLEAAGHAIAGRRIFMAGAGGAAAGIGFALAARGARTLAIHNRTAARAEALAARIRASFPACEVRAAGPEAGGHDIVVNATSAGLDPSDPLPCDLSRLAPPAVAAEVIMRPRETRFLREAAARGCAVHHGEAMAAAQMGLIAAFTGAVPAG
jgi:shikimate dehydrogenase